MRSFSELLRTGFAHWRIPSIVERALFSAQVPDDDIGEEADGMDEAICPCDFNMIIDDDMREIIEPLDPGGARRGDRLGGERHQAV